MLIPEEYRHAVSNKAIALLDDPRTKVLFVGPDGIVIQNYRGDKLTVTNNNMWLDLAPEGMEF